MSKSKSVAKTGKPNKPEVLSKVKDAGVTKPAQTMKAKSKDLAKKVAEKEHKKSKKEKVKEPTPEPSSDSEEDDSSDNDSESESESDTEIQKPVANGKTNGVAKATAHDSSDESESDDSASSESSDEEDEGETPIKVNGSGKVAAQEDSDSEESDSSDDDAAPAVAKKATLGVDSEEDSDSDDSASDSETETKPVKKTAAAQDSEDSSDESDSADEESDESEEEPKIETKITKRKAEDNVAPLAKKNKSESADSSGSKNLFVGNLSWNIDEAWLREVFEEHGELSGVRLMTDRATGRSKGFGYVEFVNAEDAATAHTAKNGFELDGRAMNVDFATGKPSEGQKQETRRKSYGDQLSEPTDTLFVGNIAFDVGQEQVTEAFSPYGTILGVRLPTDRETGAPKGFGYVNYSSVDEAKTALDAMQGFYLSSRPLRLDYSQPRPANNDSPGRGRGGFGGRGGGGFGGRGGGGGFGGRGGSRGGRGGSFGNPRGGRGGPRGGSTNRGGFGDFSGRRQTFDD